jgi:hypothetical protein
MQAWPFFPPLVRCPNCEARIDLDAAKFSVPIPEQSRPNHRVSLSFTICPACQREFGVEGEQSAALVTFAGFIGCLLLSALVPLLKLTSLLAAVLVLVLQNKIRQLVVRVYRVPGSEPSRPSVR